MPRNTKTMTPLQEICMECLINRQKISIEANTVLRNIVSKRFMSETPERYFEAIL